MITLTTDQQNALDQFTQFLLDPAESVFVLSGYSGTGKTTLVTALIDQLPTIMKTARLINPKVFDYPIELTATTNKAAETFSHITGQDVSTIHSFLGLRVQKDFRTNETRLVPRNTNQIIDTLIFIDEASYIDAELLSLIFQRTKDCKIVFMGDPAQLTPVKATHTPVFSAKFPGVELTQVVRQAEGNPIQDLSTKFRETVNTGQFFSFTPDGDAIQHLPREQFEQAALAEFTRPDWRYRDSKILGWTNRCVIGYNHTINAHTKGTADFQVGDSVICNKYLQANKVTIKTDELVLITRVEELTSSWGVVGRYYTLNYTVRAFCPLNLADKLARIKQARDHEDFHIVSEIEDGWADLRAAYACTINKAQGSTYDRVFIDLDDVSRCTNGNQIARMLYVGVSRARHQVILTGDFV